MIQEYKTTNPELAILGLIAEKPVHGYEIEQIIAQRGMRQWTEIGFSSIYHVVNKLESSGMLYAEIQPAGGRPARRVFSITPLGMDILREEIQRRLTSPRPHSSDMELALGNYIILPRAVFLEGLRVQRQHLSQSLEQVKAKWHSDRLNPGFPAHANDLFDYSCHILEAKLAWLDAFQNRPTHNPSPINSV